MGAKGSTAAMREERVLLPSAPLMTTTTTSQKESSDDILDNDVSENAFWPNRQPEVEIVRVCSVPVDCTRDPVEDLRRNRPEFVRRLLSTCCYPQLGGVLSGHSVVHCYAESQLMLAIASGSYDLLPDLVVRPGCLVNQVNCEGHTALDLLIFRMFPVRNGSDHVHLRPEPSPGAVPDWSTDSLPEAMRLLLRSGGEGGSLGWFILHILSEERLMGDLGCCVKDLASKRLLVKLLLQTSVKYCQERNFRFLLEQGTSLLAFWEPVSNTACFRDVQVVTWNKVCKYVKQNKLGALCECVLDSIQLPINSALLLLRAANSPEVLQRIVLDLIRPIDPFDYFQTGRAIEIFFPYATLCRTFPETNFLATLEGAGYPLNRVTFELEKLDELYNVDLAEYLDWRERTRGMTSLAKLCRKCIRMNLNKNSFYGINRLPLPESLRDFLKRSDDAC